MTRIISGRAGGRRIQAPPGSATRPTSDRVREALFSRLEHLDVLQGARVLDLYAGSGALGLEAASRGAAAVVLVEQARPAAAVIRRNAASLADVLPEVHVRAEPVVYAPPADVDFVFSAHSVPVAVRLLVVPWLKKVTAPDVFTLRFVKVLLSTLFTAPTW